MKTALTWAGLAVAAVFAYVFIEAQPEARQQLIWVALGLGGALYAIAKQLDKDREANRKAIDALHSRIDRLEDRLLDTKY